MIRRKKENNNTTKMGKMFAVVAFATVLSQLPFFVSRGLASAVSMAIWSFVAIICLMRCEGRVVLRNINTPLVISFAVFLFLGVMGLLNNEYFRSSVPRAIAIALFVLMIGNLAAPHLNKEDLDTILLGYAFGTVLLALAVYFEFLRGAIYTRIFLYDEKNSTALILLTGLIVFISELSTKKAKKPIWIVVCLICSAVLGYCLLVMQCRAVYVSLAVVIVIFVFSSGLNKKVKLLVALAVIAAIVFYTFNAKALDNFLEKYIYAGRNRTNIDDISSGRAIEWRNFWNDLEDGFFLGNGKMKRESLVLTALLEFGFIFGTLVLFLAVYPLLFAWRNLKPKTLLFVLFFSIAVSFIVNMFFEQLAPFGPGVKCFLLWFLMGVCAAWKTDERIEI